MAQGEPRKASMDAGLRMAMAHEWRDHGPRSDPIQVFLRRLKNQEWPQDAELIATAGAWSTAWVPISALDEVSKNCDIWLAEPIQPMRRVVPQSTLKVDVLPSQESLKANDDHSTLLGVIDDGCPYAHAALRHEDGGTRVVALWDQNGPRSMNPPGAPRYGRVWTQAALNGLMTSSQRPGGGVDEAACYRRAGLSSLVFRHTHGSHVIGRLAGSTFLQSGRRDWKGAVGAIPMRDAASHSDVAFVQLPAEALQTISPDAVAFHAFNGVHYLIHLAKKMKYKRLVVALAYENHLGSHDSASWFESALDQLISGTNEPAEFEVRVVLAAGNSGLRRAHARLSLDDIAVNGGTGARGPVHFYLAPDTEVPTWVELWLPTAWLDPQVGLGLSVKGPHSQQQSLQLPDVKVDIDWPSKTAPALSVYGMTGPKEGKLRRRVLIRFAPTRVSKGPTAAHGLWTLQMQCEVRPFGDMHDVDAHLYVVRAGANMNQPVQARQSRLVIEDEGDRQRTLSGFAGGKQVIVASAAYPGNFPYDEKERTAGRGRAGPLALPWVIGPKRPAGYSSAASPAHREGGKNLIDALAATEDGLFLSGQLDMATRSGGVFRMSGTSVAVPTAARWIAALRSWPEKPGCIATASTGGHAGASGSPSASQSALPYEVWTPTSATVAAGKSPKRPPKRQAR